MKFLKRPMSKKDDLKVIGSACGKYSWEEREIGWRKAYKRYRRHGGNPWKVSPMALSEEEAEQHYDLYGKRRSGGQVKRIRDTKNLLSCPVCGSGTTGHVDHYLPRSEYPEFSIMFANLVPACPHCNSGVKGAHVKGVKNERFIHPYFDVWADKALWHVEFVPPFEAMRFSPAPSMTLPRFKQKVVRFHLSHVLGDQFHRSMENKWSTLPSLLNLNIKSSKTELKHTRKAIKKELAKALATTGINSWDSAFFRGLLNDNSAIAFLHDLRLGE